MFRIYQFDRDTAFIEDGVLHGTFTEIAKSSSQEVTFVDTLPTALYGPSPYKRHFALVVEQRRTIGTTVWFFPHDTEINPMFADDATNDRKRKELLDEISSRKARPKPNQPGIKLISKNDLATLTKEANSIKDDAAESLKTGLVIEVVCKVISTMTNYTGSIRVHFRDIEKVPGTHIYQAGYINHREHIHAKPSPTNIPHDLYMPLYAAITKHSSYRGEVWVAFENVKPCPKCGAGYMITFIANGDESTLRHQCDPVPKNALLPSASKN